MGNNTSHQGIWHILKNKPTSNQSFQPSLSPKTPQPPTSGEAIVGLNQRVRDAEARLASSSILNAVSRLQATKAAADVPADVPAECSEQGPSSWLVIDSEVEEETVEETVEESVEVDEPARERPSWFDFDSSDECDEFDDDGFFKEPSQKPPSWSDLEEQEEDPNPIPDQHLPTIPWPASKTAKRPASKPAKQPTGKTAGKRPAHGEISPRPNKRRTAHITPLTEAALNQHTHECRQAEPPVEVPPGPYPFLANPWHPMLGRLTPSQIGCQDGCLDDETYVPGVFKSWRTVHAWFDRHFRLEDAQAARVLDPGCIQDKKEEWHVEEPFLFGATECNELWYLKDLYEYAGEIEQEQQHSEAERVKKTMRVGEWESWGLYPYYHGRDYCNIRAEYEPRYIPTDGWWPYDDAQLIWEARAVVGPGQDEASRRHQTEREYWRQWRMYRKQDEARMRYVNEVRELGRWQYHQAGVLPVMGERDVELSE